MLKFSHTPVSVIIPVKDRHELLIRALRSVLKQSHRPLEIIVVDDHSLENLSKIQQDMNREISSSPERNFIWLKNSGSGVSAARNSGIRMASHSLIAFLDSDDEWDPEKLSQQVEMIMTHPQYPLVHTEEIWIRNGVRVNPRNKHKKSGGRIFKNSIRLCLISPSATLLKRSLLEEVGLFNEDFVVCEDYELWLRITCRYEVGFLENPLTVKYGGHDDQLSRKYHSMDLWRVRALKNYINHPSLSSEEEKAVRSELEKKCGILLKGFEKHRNFENFEEVKAIAKKNELTNR